MPAEYAVGPDGTVPPRRHARVRRRRRAGASLAVTGVLGALALSGSVVLPGPAADAAPPDLVPPAAGILPGPAPSDAAGTPGAWGPCVPDDASADSCTGWSYPPSTAGPQGTDNAPNVIVGGSFVATDGAAESEGLHVVQGDATFERRPYNVGVVGVGSLVTPAHRADMLVVGGDLTVANPSVNMPPDAANVIVGGSVAPFRTGTIRVGGAHNFRDPSYDSTSSPYGQLGELDTANQDPPPSDFQNLLYDDVSVLESDHYTDLFGAEGAMTRYSQQCYAELSTTTATSVVNEGGTLSLEHGEVTQQGTDLTLASDGTGDVVVFDLPATLGTTSSGVNIHVTGVADGATVLVNTLTSGPVRQNVANVDWDGASYVEALEHAHRVLWNYPFSTDLTIGGGAQLPGSVLVGEPASTLDQGLSGVNGRTYTPGDLVHSASLGGSGKEFHAYPFDGALGCAQAAPGTFQVAKEVAGDGADQVPADSTFTVDWEVTGPADSANLGRTGSLDVPADGTPVTGPADLAEGDEVTLSEPELPDVDGVDWGDPAISPNPITIGGTDTVTEVNVTNTATLQRGGFTISKEVAGDAGASTTEFDVAWQCSAANAAGDDSGTVTVADGESATLDGFTVGTTCTITEETPTDDNGTWADPTIEPGEITVTEGDATANVVTVTNTFDADEPTGGFTIAKEVTGDAGASTTEFSGTWTCSAPDADGDTTGTWTLADGGRLAVDGFPVGTECTVTEDDPTDDNGTWTSSLDPAGGELAITEDEASANVVTVTNDFTSTVGAFAVTKEVTGDAGASVDEFPVDWTCTTPDGDELTGSVTLAAGTTSDPITGDGDGFPVGTTCTISEPEIEDPNGSWTADVSPDEITIGSDDPSELAQVTVTNTFSTAPLGGFTVAKQVAGDASGASATEFSGTWTCSAANAAGDDDGTWVLAAGDELAVDGFPAGTTCEVAEHPVDDEHGTWSARIDPGGEFAVAEEGAAARVVTVTNTFTPVAPSPSPSPSTPAPTPSESTPAPTPSDDVPAPGPDGPSVLPQTGAGVLGLVVVAVVLVGAGTAAVLAVRRRVG